MQGARLKFHCGRKRACSGPGHGSIPGPTSIQTVFPALAAAINDIVPKRPPVGHAQSILSNLRYDTADGTTHSTRSGNRRSRIFAADVDVRKNANGDLRAQIHRHTNPDALSSASDSRPLESHTCSAASLPTLRSMDLHKKETGKEVRFIFHFSVSVDDGKTKQRSDKTGVRVQFVA